MEKNKMRNQTGLVRRGAIYHIRIKVPADLRDDIPQKTEIVRSLRTKDRREAESKLHIERVKWDKEFAHFRSARLSPREILELQPQEIEEYRLYWLRHWLVTDEESRLNDKSGDAYENTENYLLGYASEIGDALGSGNTKSVERDVDHLLAADGTVANREKGGLKFLYTRSRAQAVPRTDPEGGYSAHRLIAHILRFEQSRKHIYGLHDTRAYRPQSQRCRSWLRRQ